jgi:hypothetical protein
VSRHRGLGSEDVGSVECQYAISLSLNDGFAQRSIVLDLETDTNADDLR